MPKQKSTNQKRKIPLHICMLHFLILTCTFYYMFSYDGILSHPNATSNAIISVKPTANISVPTLECSPSDISGISSSTTT